MYRDLEIRVRIFYNDPKSNYVCIGPFPTQGEAFDAGELMRSMLYQFEHETTLHKKICIACKKRIHKHDEHKAKLCLAYLEKHAYVTH